MTDKSKRVPIPLAEPKHIVYISDDGSCPDNVKDTVYFGVKWLDTTLNLNDKRINGVEIDGSLPLVHRMSEFEKAWVTQIENLAKNAPPLRHDYTNMHKLIEENKNKKITERAKRIFGVTFPTKDMIDHVKWLGEDSVEMKGTAPSDIHCTKLNAEEVIENYYKSYPELARYKNIGRTQFGEHSFDIKGVTGGNIYYEKMESVLAAKIPLCSEKYDELKSNLAGFSISTVIIDEGTDAEAWRTFTPTYSVSMYCLELLGYKYSFPVKDNRNVSDYEGLLVRGKVIGYDYIKNLAERAAKRHNLSLKQREGFIALVFQYLHRVAGEPTTPAGIADAIKVRTGCKVNHYSSDRYVARANYDFRAGFMALLKLEQERGNENE